MKRKGKKTVYCSEDEKEYDSESLESNTDELKLYKINEKGVRVCKLFWNLFFNNILY